MSVFLRTSGTDVGLSGIVGSREAAGLIAPKPVGVGGRGRRSMCFPFPYLELALCIILCDMCMFTVYNFVLLFKYASVHIYIHYFSTNSY